MHSSTPSISEHLLCSVSSALPCKIWWYHNSITGYFWNNTEPAQKLWWASCWTLDTDTKKKHWQARIALLQLLPLANIFHKQNQHLQRTRYIFWREEEGFCYLFLFGILFFLGFLFIYALILFTGLNVVSMF